MTEKSSSWAREYGSAFLLALTLLLGVSAGAIFGGPGLTALRAQVLDWPAKYFVIAPFFFLVGLELRREFSHGALRPLRNALSPALAAVFGVAFPALWFVALNLGTFQVSGWPIPTATDVTFALAVYTAFGSALPRGARTFLLAFAVIDDLIAVILITLVFGLSAESGFVELVPVLLAFALPLRWPARVEKQLAGYLNLVGLPIFAFFMGAVSLPPAAEVVGSLVFWGVVVRPVWKWLGVFVGGRLGQLWATGQMKLDSRVLAAVASLGGIGFTVSLLVAGIAYKADPAAFSAALLATFIASGISAALAGLALLRGHRS